MGQMVEFASNGGTCQGYLAAPEGGGPGVIVIQEWWGLVPHIIGLVERFAAAGFVALAPDFYRGVATTEPDEAQKLMIGLRVAEAAKDMVGAAAYLVARPDVTSRAVGAVGFCMGGGLALLAGSVSADIAATVAFYPGTPWPDYHPDWSAYTGKNVLIHKAESDEPHSEPLIASLTQEITVAGGSVTAYSYPGSLHAFFNNDRPEVYAPEHSSVAWQRTVDLFRADLV
jgi:carboxymethylenebutenolidase